MMFPNNDYVRRSLELNLFFLRIMKEHALFLATGFLPKELEYMNEALRYNQEFNNLLVKTVDLSKGVVQIDNDDVTDHTIEAESVVSELTGVPIDTNLTRTQLNLRNENLNRIEDPTLLIDVRDLNNRAIRLTRNLIRYKSRLLDDVLKCNIMFHHYPTFIDHNRMEAIFFVDLLTQLENEPNEVLKNTLIEKELFWNHIMEEHAEFVRGLVDPCEVDLMIQANDFAIKYNDLNERVSKFANNASIVPEVTKESLNLTKQIKNFKTTATVGLIECEIRSLLNPLIADHVTREANHYIRILERKH